MAHQGLEMLRVHSRKHLVEPAVRCAAQRAQIARLRRIECDADVHELTVRNVVHISEYRIGVEVLVFHARTLLTSFRAGSILPLTWATYLNALSIWARAEFHASGIAARYASSRASAMASHAPANRSRFNALPRSCSENRWLPGWRSDSRDPITQGGRQPTTPSVIN